MSKGFLFSWLFFNPVAKVIDESHYWPWTYGFFVASGTKPCIDSSKVSLFLNLHLLGLSCNLTCTAGGLTMIWLNNSIRTHDILNKQFFTFPWDFTVCHCHAQQHHNSWSPEVSSLEVPHAEMSALWLTSLIAVTLWLRLSTALPVPHHLEHLLQN